MEASSNIPKEKKSVVSEVPSQEKRPWEMLHEYNVYISKFILCFICYIINFCSFVSIEIVLKVVDFLKKKLKPVSIDLYNAESA